MDIYEKLQEAGLTGNESKLYLELMKKGDLSANQLAKNLGMDRTLSYTILNHLIEKGQISYVIKQNKKIFRCSNPENLINRFKAKEVLINELISELNKIKKSEQKETEINVYEGKDGLRTFIKLVLKEKEFLSFGSTGRLFYSLYEAPSIANKAKKIKARIIGDKKLKGTEAFNIKNIEFSYLKVQSEATTCIFGDYVSIHIIKDKPLIIIIKDKDISKSYRNHFELLWKLAKK